jgi:hypothetical protein
VRGDGKMTGKGLENALLLSPITLPRFSEFRILFPVHSDRSRRQRQGDQRTGRNAN